jgi:hypothetical protein
MSLCGSATSGLEIAYSASGKIIPVGYQPGMPRALLNFA